MKKILFGLIILIIISLFLISGCAQEQKVVCNKPYILVGTSCCLDQNNNNICDKDEVEEKPDEVKTPVVEKKEEPEAVERPKEEVKEDLCGNNICDEGEDCETCEKDCGKCFSLGDLQADINKVIDWRIILQKIEENDKYEHYGHISKTAYFLGKIGTNYQHDYFPVTPVMYVLVNKIKNRDDYLKDDQDFYKFIKNNREVLLSIVEDKKAAFQDDFDDEHFMKRIFGDNDYKKYTFNNSLIDTNNIYFDNITKMQTVGNKIIENIFIGLTNYNVTYDYRADRTSEPYPKVYTFSGLDYEHFVSVHCNPSLVINIYSIYKDGKVDYNPKTSSWMWRTNEDYFSDEFEHDIKNLLIDATALVSMCEQRYEFTYLRYR